MVKQAPEERLNAVRFCAPAQECYNFYDCGYRITVLRPVANRSTGVRLPLPAPSVYSQHFLKDAQVDKTQGYYPRTWPLCFSDIPHCCRLLAYIYGCPGYQLPCPIFWRIYRRLQDSSLYLGYFCFSRFRLSGIGV